MHLRLVASKGTEHGGPRCGHGEHPLLAELSPDAVELSFLRMMRCACIGLRDGSIRALDVAHQVAEHDFGLARGAMLAGCIVALLRALRRERRAKVAFMAPECPACSERVSSAERQILLLVRAGRCRDAVLLEQRAKELALSHTAPTLAEVGRVIGDLLGPMEKDENGTPG